MIAGGDAGSAGSHHGDSQSQSQVQHSVTETGSVVRSEQIAVPALPVCASTIIRRVYFCICCKVDTSSSNHAEDARNRCST